MTRFASTNLLAVFLTCACTFIVDDGGGGDGDLTWANGEESDGGPAATGYVCRVPHAPPVVSTTCEPINRVCELGSHTFPEEEFLGTACCDSYLPGAACVLADAELCSELAICPDDRLMFAQCPPDMYSVCDFY